MLRLVDVAKNPSVDNLPDIADADAVFFGEQAQVCVSAVIGIPRSYGADFIVGQFSATSTTPHCDISHVLNLSSEIEVVWVDACPDIAGMQDVEALRYRAVVDFPRDTVGEQARASVSAEFAVPLVNYWASPNPAITRHIDMFPESFLNGAGSTCVVAGTGTIPCGVMPNGAGRDVERRSASLAGSTEGKIGAHPKLLTSGAMPPAVPSSAGALSCPDYTSLSACISRFSA